MNGWACGDAVYKTVNSGSNWSASQPFPDWIDAIFFISTNIGWTAHSNLAYSKISKTTDGGNSWNDQFSVSALTMIFNNIFFIDENNGWIVGPRSAIMAPNTIYRTNNGGLTWIPQVTDIMGLYQVVFADINKGWAVGAKFVSYDSIVVQTPIILNTTNGGAVPVELVSFTSEITPDGIKLFWNTATELNNYGFEIQRKTNSVKWTTLGFKAGNGTSTNQHSYTFIDKLDIKDEYFYRLKQIDFDGKSTYSETIKIDFSLVPTNFELFQNYPNPFNPNTKISWQSPVSSWQTLKVYDLLGNKVAILVDEYKSAGVYEVEFESASVLTNLASGIYFCQLKIGDKVKTRKMILLR